jgi:membrane protein YdbS with pleckstrin-like domain
MQEPQPTQAIGPAVFVVTAGPARGSRVQIPSGGLLIGRSGDPDDQLFRDPALSRQHARLTPWTGGVLVEDMGSRNGTAVNGHRIHSQLVHVGDVVTVGETQLQLVDDRNGPHPGPSQPARTALIAAPAPHEQPHGAASGRPAAPQQPPRPAAAASRQTPPVPPHPAAPAAPYPAVRPLPPQAGAGPGGGPGQPRPPGAAPAVSRPLAPGSPAHPDPGFATLVTARPSIVAYLGRYLGPLVRAYLVIGGLAVVCAVGSAIAKHYLGSRVPAAALPSHWAGPLTAALAVASVVAAVAKALQVFATRFRLDRGILQIEQGVMERHATSIDLARVHTVELRQTLLQRLSADGTLAIYLSGETQPLLVTGLARGHQLHQLYQELNNPASHLRQRQS